MDKRPIEVIFAEFETWGEETVRQKFELGHFGSDGEKRAIAKLWLDGKNQERLELSEDESKATARSAKKAAWAAAIAAIIAAIAAIASIVISLLNQTPS